MQGAKGKRVTISVPKAFSLTVKEGSKVLKGQPLNEGYRDPKKIYLYENKMAAFKYILNELKKVYNFQGAEIHDKHVEIIVRKIFSRVRIKDPGDSNFVSDEIVEKDIFLTLNQELRASRKKPAKGVLVILGITKVALSSFSFLSAASFQETSRVLIKAALESKEDPIKGLKENIILGRKPMIGKLFRDMMAEKAKVDQSQSA